MSSRKYYTDETLVRRTIFKGKRNCRKGGKKGFGALRPLNEAAPRAAGLTGLGRGASCMAKWLITCSYFSWNSLQKNKQRVFSKKNTRTYIWIPFVSWSTKGSEVSIAAVTYGTVLSFTLRSERNSKHTFI